MAMYGWIASTPGFEDKVQSPQTLNLLRKFSYSEGKPAYRFELGDVADTHNDQGSYDHTVWIEIYDNATKQKIGEVSTDISDASVGPISSKYILLAASLERLGFVDEDTMESTPEEPSQQPAPPVDPTHAARIIAATRILTAIASTGIELGDPSMDRSRDPNPWGASDARLHAQEDTGRLRKAQEKLHAFYKKLLGTEVSKNTCIADYLRESNGDWGTLFKNRRFIQIGNYARTQLDKFLKSEAVPPGIQPLSTEELNALKNQYGSNITDLLRMQSQPKISSVIASLDNFIKCGNTLNFKKKD